MQPDSSTGLNGKGQDLKIVSLISIGQHPASGRARRAEQDGRAVELGMTLAASSSTQNLTVLHAGDSQQAALRSYAGMGLESVRVLQLRESADAVKTLSEYLHKHAPDIILTGVRAESGESSGMMPYLLGESLGWPVVSRIADIVSIKEGVAEILQALPRGQRRALTVRLPFIASVDNAAPEPRQSAFGPANRAFMEQQQCHSEPDTARNGWSIVSARKRPKRLKIVKAKTAADRFKAATAKPQGAGGKIMKNQPAAEQAQAIFDLLLEEGVLR
ncbi:electron transfer flavoprotein subunit beta [Neptunomonas antarctica]|uniref:Electron transfer flavoprotein beta subunit n=1 Tax=Neptunomonas antarctica TaxID=619304 RepID=A0A1N7K2W2_9GAMM|nr:electron transfer flavoprotein subunit beta [Neptunomonas antarctica]SIS55945.1 electron transfer flavoprotein beta subunit [Neptunomonas antarctica]